MKNVSGFVLLGLLAVTAHAAPSPVLTLAKTVPLPGVTGRLDHLALDAQSHLLYVAASENNTVEVVDLKAARRIRRFEVKDPHDLLSQPKPNLLYVTSGSEGQVKVFDCAAGRPLKTIGRLPDADNVRFDAPGSRLYVAYGAGALAMINAQTGVQTATISLTGHPEAFAIEQIGGRIFVNVPAAKHVAVVDRLMREVIATWTLAALAGNYALALDEANQRLFVGCRQPPRLVVLDTKSGRRVADQEIAGDVDNLFYDAKGRRVYASCGEGFLEVADQTDADHYAMRPRIPTTKGARTSLFVEAADTLFLAVPQREGQPAELRRYHVAP